MPAQDHRVPVDNGKYTFVVPAGDYVVQILRHGAPWLEVAPGSKALHAAMCELDAARVVLAAARACAQAGTAPAELLEALKLHEGLVSDHEPPSEWIKPR